MYKIRQSLDAVGYAAYFWEGTPLTLEEVIERATRFGYEAVDIWPFRPIAFPMDVDRKRRKKILEFAGSKDIKFGAVEAVTDGGAELLAQGVLLGLLEGGKQPPQPIGGIDSFRVQTHADVLS